MDKLVIPPNSNWFSQSICYCTHDNGLIYGATSKIVYIPPKSEKQEVGLKLLDLKKKLHCFALCPSFKETKRLAVLNGDSQVLVYNFETEEVLHGHKGHGADELGKLNQHSAITFSTENVVLSSLNSDVVKFCLLTNTFKTYPDFSNRNPISIMKPSPRNHNLIAAGTKNGLILIIDSEKMDTPARFRGHDLEITSLDFMAFPMKPKSGNVSTNKSKKKKSQREQEEEEDEEVAAEEDIFDIYSAENVENEFGVYQESGAATAPGSSNKSDDIETPLKEKIHDTSSFNFLEECSTLKDFILSNNNESANAPAQNAGKFEDNKEQYEATNEENISVSLESNPSSHTPVLTEESLNYLDECQRMKDFNTYNANSELVVLASGSRENVVWFWNVNEMSCMQSIKWHPKAKSHLLPATFTNVLWMNSETLLLTDNNGDIIEYKIKFDQEKKLISAQKQKQTFDVKGALNICKSDDSSLLWVSSIHRHICCLETKTYTKTVSLDTVQFRIHYIIESPIDSNLIAIGGNDKRLCLWNTSESNHHFILLKPYMNKIQSSVLCISWHPVKDNILAFGTREGRVGMLDTNKSSNVPVILESFTTHEIYSLTWTKYTDAKGEEIVILLACSSGKLVYYNYKDFKMNVITQVAHCCSVASNANILAVGTSSGTVYVCDILKDLEIVAEAKVCRKYVGMITWHEDNLAICTESDIALVKGVKSVLSTVDFQKSIVKLPHQKRVYSARFNKAGDRIVSTCMNGNITVWNLDTLSAVTRVSIGTPAYCAIFMPNDETLIVCGGQDSTIHSFEWEKYPIVEGAPEKAKNEDKLKHLVWGVLSEVTVISKNKNRRVKKKIQPKSAAGVSDITSELKTMKLSNKKVATLFHAANREISIDPTSYLEMLLNEDPARESSLNEKMFGNRSDIKAMIEKELEFEPNQTSGFILPQITDDLKQEIMERILKKTLTEMHIAIAPSISYDLWRKCCLAYGTQCIENEDFVRAIPFLLAINDIETCINALCESKHFREAWVIAKMRKDQKDPAFDKIFQQWIAFYDHNGNFETAAALLCIKKEYKHAHEILDKRQNKDEKLAAVIDKLTSKI